MREIVLTDDIKTRISNIQAEHDFSKEIGGIIVGKYDPEFDCFLMTDMSFPYPSDVQSRFRFSRKSAGHQEFMDMLWKESGMTKAYLGEWHTHDQNIPIPSFIDRKTWRRIARRNNNYDQCFFMIIGRKQFAVWTAQDNDVYEIRGDWEYDKD